MPVFLDEQSDSSQQQSGGSPITLNPTGTVSPVALLDYLTDVQRLLHDSSFNFWSKQELYDYINKSRKMVAAETLCTRTLATIDIIAATTRMEATYPFAYLIENRIVTDVLDVLLQYTATQNFPLRYFSFDDVKRTSLWQYQQPGTPSHFTILNRNVIILQWPQQNYLESTFDCALQPINLVEAVDNNEADLEADLPFPYTECVGFYAAYLAKLKDQRRQEAEDFFKDYQRRKLQALGTEFTRRLIGR
jgi:hypothetical protein